MKLLFCLVVNTAYAFLTACLILSGLKTKMLFIFLFLLLCGFLKQLENHYLAKRVRFEKGKNVLAFIGDKKNCVKRIAPRSLTEHSKDANNNSSSKIISSVPERPNAPYKKRTGTLALNPSVSLGQFEEPANSPTSSSAVSIPEEAFDASKCNFTLNFISSNCQIQDNGLVLPQQYPSGQFKRCLTFYLQEGYSLPFKLQKDFFNYVSSGKGFADYSNGKSEWNKLPNISKNSSRMSIWKPKVRPMSVQFENHPLSVSLEAKDLLLSLDSLDLARLQSLIFYSSRSERIGKKGKITVTVSLDSNRQTCAIHLGSLVIPQFTDKVLLKEQIVELLKNDNPFEEKRSRYNDSRKEKKEIVLKPKDLNGNESKISKQINANDKRPQPHKRTKTGIPSLNHSSSAHTTTSTTLRTLTQPTGYQFIKNPFIYHETSVMESMYTMFELLVNKINSNSFESFFNRLECLLQNDLVEYIALDCEMTGLYTVEDDKRHSLNTETVFMNNTKQIKDGAKVNSVFQLGLVIKIRHGGWSIWNFHTAPELTKESFTPSTFKFLLEKPLTEKHPEASSDAISNMISEKLKTIRSSSICHQQLASLADLLINSFTPFIVYSGFADLLHLFKTIGRSVDELDHDVIQGYLCNRIYDLKSVCLSAPIYVAGKPSLSTYFHSLYPHLPENKSSLHNAAFDALLTAMLYEALKNRHPLELDTRNGLFSFE